MFLYVSLGQKASYEGLADKPRGGDEHKWNFTKIYVDNLQLETKSLMSETTDGGMGTEGAPSEFDVDIGGQYRKVKITHVYFLFSFWSWCDDRKKTAIILRKMQETVLEMLCVEGETYFF